MRFEYKRDEIAALITLLDVLWENIGILMKSGESLGMTIPLIVEMQVKKIRKYGKYDYFENQVLTQIEEDVKKLKEKTGMIGFQPPFGEEDGIEDEETMKIEKIIDQKLAKFKKDLIKELKI